MRQKGWNATQLKLFAAFTMLIDHVTFTFLERTISPVTGTVTALSSQAAALLDLFGRGVGRQAFPIFAFFVAQGYIHTRSRKRYLGRLLLFAVISQLPYHLMCYTGPVGSTKTVGLNVYVTLALGLAAVWILDETVLQPSGLGAGKTLRGLAGILAVLGLCLLAWVLNADYDCMGVLSIVIFYVLRRYPVWSVLAVWIWLGCGSSMEWLALPGCLLLLLYNGKRGGGDDRNPGNRWGFYLFYPVHMAILWGLRLLLCGA